MNDSKKMILKVSQGAIIAALYVVITFVFAPISFGPLQIRISEILTVLPFFSPAAVPGLFVGCLIANVLGGTVFWDVSLGLTVGWYQFQQYYQMH